MRLIAILGGMKRLMVFVLLAWLWLGCAPTAQQQLPGAKGTAEASRMVSPTLQQLLDSARLRGVMVIYDATAHSYYANDFALAAVGRLPASTYKIPHSLIALETGVVADDSTLFPWDGEPRYLKSWEEDLMFRQAFHRSCVPCYQQVARQVGVARMREQLQRLDFGEMQVTEETLDRFWLQGESRISPLQQIDFLRRFCQGSLPLQARTQAIAREMFVIEATERYRLSGKTGWSIIEAQHNGWFVGYLEVDEALYLFATNLDPTSAFDMDDFASARKEITLTGLKRLGFMPE